MSDIVLVAVIVAFLAAAALLVRVIDRMIADPSEEQVTPWRRRGRIDLPMLILGPIGERIVG